MPASRWPVQQAGGVHAMAEFALNVLGPLRLQRVAGDEIVLRSKACAAILAYLAVNCERRHKREKLVGLIWPDRTDDQARNSLRQALFVLRQAFGNSSSVIAAEGDEVWLDPQQVDIDVSAFEKLAASGDPGSIEKAIALYQGDLADDLYLNAEPFESWIQIERVRLRELALENMSRLAAHCAANGDTQAAIRVNRKIIGIEATREDAHRALMRLYLATGERSVALKQYAECAAILRRELDTEPNVETTRLYNEIHGPRGLAAPGPALAAPSSDGAMAQKNQALVPITTSKRSARLRFAAIGGLLAIAIAAGATWYALSPESATRARKAELSRPPDRTGHNEKSAGPVEAPTPVSKPAERARASTPFTFVVLPFLNVSEDKDYEWFANGVTEELTTDLSRIVGATVVSRTTAYTYKNKSVDVRQIARELNVRYVIEGSVRRDADQVRINVQLIDGDGGGHLWAERYAVERNDLAKTQDEMLASITWAVHLQLIDIEGRRFERDRLNNPAAVDLMMRAVAIWNSGETEKNLREVESLLVRATELDPRAARIWANLALARANLALAQTPGMRDRALIDDAQRTAEHALGLDQRQHNAYRALGHVMRMRGRGEDALAAFERAVTLAPWALNPRHNVATAYLHLGRPADTIVAETTLIRMSPRDPNVNIWYMTRCRAHTMLNQFDQAVADCDNALNSGKRYWWIVMPAAVAHALAGQSARAAELVSELRSMKPDLTVRRCRSDSPSGHPEYLSYHNRTCDALEAAGLPP